MMHSFLFKGPAYIKYGVGVVKELTALCEELSMTHILFVTGNHIRKSEEFAGMKSCMDSAHIAYDIYSDIPTEPTVSLVDAAASFLKEHHCDGIVAIGGGSILDTAKAIALLGTNPGSARDYMFGSSGVVSHPALPLICIPTTAGSGSEVTASSVILDEEKGVKLSITHNYLFPKYALIDPTLHLSMPHKITISTGMDAMTHAIEAYTSTTSNAMSDMYALTAISMISQTIGIVAKEPDNLEARGTMALASTLAALAFVNGGLGIVHGISQAMGGLAHVPHGIGNAILLPYCLTLNERYAVNKFAAIAHAMNLSAQSSDPSVLAATVPDAIRKLSIEIGIPASTREFALTPDMFPAIVKETMAYRLLKCNPAPVTPEIVEDILNQSYYA